jgi:hypothetical protein
VHERAPILDDVGRNPIVESLKTAWRNFVGFVAGFIASLGFIIPLLVLVALVWYLVKRMRRPRNDL